jgi:two-component system, OmpR family, alkaline phosphatase synthesis response regulator PhoP
MVVTLVVDDDVAVLDLMASLLRGVGHDVTTATDGLEARDLLLGGAYDLCVLDHDLPGMTGLEVAGAARAAGSGSRFVLVSGRRWHTGQRLDQVDELVEKPFDPRDFLRLVDELVAS